MLFSDLFHQGRFAVPWHQRYYDWKPSDVQALLHDIEDAIKEERDCYFLGAIMLVEIEHQRWEINDGQQRMVTVSLMCAALCRRFVREAKGSQREGLALRMLFDLDANSAWTMDDAERYTPRYSDRAYKVALSNHADFHDTLAYVEATGAEKVVTDNTRNHGVELAIAINERLLGVQAQPSTNNPGPP